MNNSSTSAPRPDIRKYLTLLPGGASVLLPPRPDPVSVPPPVDEFSFETETAVEPPMWIDGSGNWLPDDGDKKKGGDGEEDEGVV